MKKKKRKSPRDHERVIKIKPRGKILGGKRQIHVRGKD